MATAGRSYFISDGKSVDVQLSATVEAGEVVYRQGWLGLAATGGDSDDYIALNIDEREYVFDVGASLSVTKGDVVYVTVASLEGNEPALSGWSTSSGAGKVALFKATTTKDSNNKVRGILLAGRS